mmetsp:Transcript_19325/g.28567  ORF Transcript_19325/g.28567 Transcript_19325/m.28567 type:complete len:213 (-) Transcript_19325:24-662(-)
MAAALGLSIFFLSSSFMRFSERYFCRSISVTRFLFPEYLVMYDVRRSQVTLRSTVFLSDCKSVGSTKSFRMSSISLSGIGGGFFRAKYVRGSIWLMFTLRSSLQCSSYFWLSSWNWGLYFDMKYFEDIGNLFLIRLIRWGTLMLSFGLTVNSVFFFQRLRRVAPLFISLLALLRRRSSNSPRPDDGGGSTKILGGLIEGGADVVIELLFIDF